LNGNYLSREIFKDGGEVNRSTGIDTFGVLSGLEKTRDTANGKARNNNNEWKNRWSGSRDRTNLVEELMEFDDSNLYDIFSIIYY
jgi:hypothetical protein